MKDLLLEEDHLLECWQGDKMNKNTKMEKIKALHLSTLDICFFMFLFSFKQAR